MLLLPAPPVLPSRDVCLISTEIINFLWGAKMYCAAFASSLTKVNEVANGVDDSQKEAAESNRLVNIDVMINGEEVSKSLVSEEGQCVPQNHHQNQG